MRKIVYTRPDGGVSVVTPVINSHPRREDITETEAEERAWKRLPVDAINPRFVASVPDDRTFRDAWLPDLSVDMAKAREIHRNRLRVLRAPLLEAADFEFMRALEKGEDTTAIVARKQALRDVTTDPRINAAQTPEELKSAVPSILQ